MSGFGLAALIVALAIILILDYWLVKRFARRWQQNREKSDQPQNVVTLFGVPSPTLTWLHELDVKRTARHLTDSIRAFPARLWSAIKRFLQNPGQYIGILWARGSQTTEDAQIKPENQPPSIISPARQARWVTWLELGLVIAWAVWVGRDYLNFSPKMFPLGGEFPMVTQSHFIWTLLTKCTTCIFWNGMADGGAPAFAETQGAVLHPLVIITTLLWGVVNGSKVLLVAALATAGLAQWWLARVMGLGRAVRLWVAAMAVVGGNLAGRMDNGAIILILSQVSAALILAPAVELYLTRQRKSAMLLGVALALTWLSGQGYIQVAVVLCFLTTFCIFLFDHELRLQKLWKDYALAIVLSILLAGIFWIPLLHFLPNFVKDGDPYLTNLQPLEYLPLNLVIRDVDFFKIVTLGHDLNLYTHVIYIGWIPVLLAFLALRLAPRQFARLQAFFWISIGLVFLICSVEFNQSVIGVLPGVQYLRSIVVASGLAVPLVLALAAWSLDSFFKFDWPKIGIFLSSGARHGLGANWLLGGLAMVLAVIPVYNFSKPWLNVLPIEAPSQLIKALTPAQSEWIMPPYSEFGWIPLLMDRGVKLTGIYRPWHWKDRPEPIPYIEAIRDPDGTQEMPSLGNIDDVGLYHHFGSEYATIKTSAAEVPCKATAMGGNIDVDCKTDTGGQLVVKENSWTGWLAWVDGHLAPLDENQWLSVQAPAGAHHYAFRYWPIDVIAGMLVTLCGFLFAIWMSLTGQSQN